MSSLSPVIIGRMALSHIGVTSNLENLSASTPETAQINTWYEPCREQTLEAFNWNFARKQLVLATHAEAPPTDQWAYRYQYPFQCLKVRKLWHPVMNSRVADAIPFEIELATDDSKSIVTNLDEARATWTKDIEDLSLWTSNAISAFSHLLASRIGPALTTKQQVGLQQLSLFNIILDAATRLDANEQVQPPERDADWIRARTTHPTEDGRYL